MKQNPRAYQKMQEMTSGKTEADMKQTAINLAREQGIDLNNTDSLERIVEELCR